MLKISKPGITAAGRPPAAIEITPEGVLAAALSGSSGTSGQPVCAFAPLPQGALVPHIEEQNLRSPEAVASAIRSALSQVSPRTRTVTLILPDTLVRVFVLDFDTLPAKAVEALSVVRFRLRKSVPFDVEQAAVSYQVLSKDESELKVLAAVVPGAILAEYESAVRAAGYEPGVVLSSSLAALESVDAMEAVLSANLSAMAITTSIANGQDLLLYRTLDLPQDSLQRMVEIQRSIAVAAAYFEDKLGARPRSLHYTGILKVADFARTVADPTFNVVEWVQKPESTLTPLPQTSFAAVAGALEGAR
jgi:type IV pilus assembly protein PilM